MVGGGGGGSCGGGGGGGSGSRGGGGGSISRDDSLLMRSWTDQCFMFIEKVSPTDIRTDGQTLLQRQ